MDAKDKKTINANADVWFGTLRNTYELKRHSILYTTGPGKCLSFVFYIQNVYLLFERIKFLPTVIKVDACAQTEHST